MSDDNKKNELQAPDVGEHIYVIDLVFQTPVAGRGAVKADSEEEAIDKVRAIYEGTSDLHITSIQEVSEEELMEILDDTQEEAEPFDTSDDDNEPGPTIH